MGLLPCNVFYDLVPPWADNYVTLWTWGWDALCAAGRRSRVLCFVLQFVPLPVPEVPGLRYSMVCVCGLPSAVW